MYGDLHEKTEEDLPRFNFEERQKMYPPLTATQE